MDENQHLSIIVTFRLKIMYSLCSKDNQQVPHQFTNKPIVIIDA